MKCEYENDIKHYKTISILGRWCNGIGNVYLAKHLRSDQMLAVKKINLDKIKEETVLIEEEIILLKQLQHNNINKILTTFVNGSDVYVITPLMGYGSCRDLINKHFVAGLPEYAIAIIIKDVLEALDYVHKHGLIHRAVRASHVLVSANGNTCLSGFRYACPIIRHGKWQQKIHSFPLSTVWNLNWLSPEVLEQNLQGYNEKSDIYSLGILICELANGSEPFLGMSNTLMLIEKLRGCTPQILDCTTIIDDENDLNEDSDIKTNYKKQASRKFSDAIHEISAFCLQRDPYDRPSASQLLAHSFFKFNRRSLQLSELLKPVIPFSDNVACNTDELESIEHMQKISEMELFSCDWDF